MSKLFFFIFNFLFSLITTTELFSQKPYNSVKKPNIIIILTDDQGYADVSYSGLKDLMTPNIDMLREDGMRFNYFYTNSPVCSPTRASIMTGKYPDKVGVPGLIRSNPKDNWGFLDPNAILLPKKLKEAGYHTAHIGKWNLGLSSPNLPNEKGFDLFHGWLEDMMEDYVVKRRVGKNFMRLNDKEIDPPGHATDIFSDWAVDYIKSRKNKDNPFFLYLAYNAPHSPVQPPKEYYQKVIKRDPTLPKKRAKLIAFIEHLDCGIGKVVRSLKKIGEYENTLIIFTSDNGGDLQSLANNGKLRDGKQSMYEGGLRVPTVIVWPNVIKKGSSSDQINSTVDIYPTLTSVVGLKPNDSFDGQSFLSTLIGNELKIEREIYFVRREGNINYGGKAYHAIRVGDWKLLQNSPYKPLELYNLKNDPFEKNNLVDEFPEKVSELNNKLMIHIQEGGETPWQKKYKQ
ncbi:MAG: N-acetylgalactosamine 6-sulfate sulfatase [Flavobacteriaceae bacterium]|nr:N-acetylgalactosamine 6-sulfate sulfatase [Flavobacteriaceae bacterium]